MNFVTRQDVLEYIMDHLSWYSRGVAVDPEVLREVAENAIPLGWREMDPDQLVDDAIALLEERADQLGLGLPPEYRPAQAETEPSPTPTTNSRRIQTMYEVRFKPTGVSRQRTVGRFANRRKAVRAARTYVQTLAPGDDGRVDIVREDSFSTVVWWWQEHPTGGFGGQVLPNGRHATVRRSHKKGGKNVEQL